MRPVMRNSLETRLGLFFALVVVAGFIMFELAGGGKWFLRGQEVRALFRSAGDLKVGDPVKLAGIPVGRVSDVRLASQSVEVVMKLDANADLRTDSVAQIRFTGMMGQNYVGIDFGSENAPRLVTGGLLKAKESADLAQVFEKLNGVADGVQAMTKSFSGDQLGQLLGPIAEVVKDNQPRINALMSNFVALSTDLTQGKGTVGKLLKDESLYTSALATVTNVNTLSLEARGIVAKADGMFAKADEMLADTRGLVGDVRKVVGGIDRGEGTLGKLLKDESLARETTIAMTNLREIMEKINRGQGTVGKVVNDDTLLRNVKLTLQKVDKATEGLEDAGPLSVLGTLIQTLF